MGRKLRSSFVALLLLQACTRNVDITAPPCEIAGKPANAGCIIVDHYDRMLVNEQTTGAFSLPGGSSKPAESAQCTAMRETYEETGIVTDVGELLYVYPNGFHVYRCRLQYRGQVADPIDIVEVQANHWIGLDHWEDVLWRYPEYVDKTRELLTTIIQR